MSEIGILDLSTTQYIASGDIAEVLYDVNVNLPTGWSVAENRLVVPTTALYLVGVQVVWSAFNILPGTMRQLSIYLDIWAYEPAYGYWDWQYDLAFNRIYAPDSATGFPVSTASTAHLIPAGQAIGLRVSQNSGYTRGILGMQWDGAGPRLWALRVDAGATVPTTLAGSGASARLLG